MAKESLTDTGADQHSSDSQDESQLDNQQHNDSADEHSEDTDSGENDSQDSDSNSSSQAQDEDDDDDDSSDDEAKNLAKFAKGQGYDDISDFTERELELLKRQKSQVDSYRNDPKRKQSADKLRKTVDEIHQPSADDNKDDAIAQKIALLEARQTTSDFFRDNDGASEYAEDMAAVLAEERENYGDSAARTLAQNLPRLLREARAHRGENSVEAAREAGRREEREMQAKRTQGSSKTGNASQRSTSTSKLDRAWIRDVYEPGNSEHEKLYAEAYARGDFN